MCGIVYTKRLDGKPAYKLVEKRYQEQKERGSEGFGFVSLNDKAVILDYVKATSEKKILENMDIKATEVMFHHRFPTSTPNFVETAHPIKVSNSRLKYDYYLIHNGIISDDDTCKERHEKLGYTYQTEVHQKWRSHGNTISKLTQYNDSECLAIELAETIESGLLEVNISGSIAFIMLQVEKGKRKASKLFFGRNSGNPLKLENQKKQFIAITSDGEGKNVEVDTLYCLDYETNIITNTPLKIGRFSYAPVGYTTTYGGYHDDGYNLREIESEIEMLESDKLELLTKMSDPKLDYDELESIQEQIYDIDAEIETYREMEYETTLKIA